MEKNTSFVSNWFICTIVKLELMLRGVKQCVIRTICGSVTG